MLIFNGKKYFVPLFFSSNVDVNALPNQVVEGIKFVGKNGVVETGTLPYYDYEDMQAEVSKGENGKLYIRSFVIKPSVMEDEVYSTVPLDQLGNANPYYVAEGHTITSKFGVNTEGTAKIYDYDPIEANKERETDTHYVFMGYVDGNTFMEDEVWMKVQKSIFGNAQPSQVLDGVIFTSENGVGEVGTMPKVAMANPTITADADEEESEIIIVAINNQQTGYAEAHPAHPPFTQSFVKLRIDGDTAIMECGDARIERKIGSTEEPTPSLVYTLSDNGAYYIVGTGFTSIEAIEADIGGGTEGSGLDSTWNGGRLVIPSEYNGKPVLAIAPRAFAGFYDITQVYVHDGITHFGHRSFQCPNKPWDTAMISCRLPNTLVWIGGEDGRVFYGRQGLTSMHIPPNVSELTRAVFAYCNSITAAYTNNIKKLVRSCFQDCSALTILNTDNMEEIGDVSFYNCSNLTELNLPKIETIGNNVFYNTSLLTKVTIGPNCRSIDVSGLRCGSTENKCTFYFEGTTPPTIQSSTFEAAKLNKIIVPKGCGNTYKTATNWVNFASYIQEEA